MNNLDETLLVLLVRREDGETAAGLFAALQKHYDARLEDSEFGPMYKIGPSYTYCNQTFSKICTFAGSLVMRMVLDTEQCQFDRAVIYRFDADGSLWLLSPGGPKVEVRQGELVEVQDL